MFTVMWGIMAIMFALFSTLLDNLIQAVNILGSIFYGIILGIFVVAFLFKFVKGNAVFVATLIGEAIVLWIRYLSTEGIVEIEYLWLNPIGCLLVVGLAVLIQFASNGFSFHKK